MTHNHHRSAMALVAIALALPATAGGDSWRDELSAICDEVIAGYAPIQQNDGTAADIARQAEQLLDLSASGSPFDEIDVPADWQRALDEIVAIAEGADTPLVDAIEAAEAGDVTVGQHGIDLAIDAFRQISGRLAVMGVRCEDAGHPARTAAAALNVPLELDSHQIAAGFDSIWVSERLGNRVVRLDPQTGAVLATIDIDDSPVKLQPADGRMWVRAVERYVAIDPATNMVVATLAKADVGPAANRSWAVDGAMWICDGRQLHRYDPTSLERVGTIALEIDCGSVIATSDLVVAVTYNEDAGESGSSAAAFIDPATNETVATIDLPVDVNSTPVILDSAVFLSGYLGSTAVVVDRATWTISATPDLGQPTSGSLAVTDGTHIYVPTADALYVVVVDAATNAVIGTIETLGSNSVALLDGSLWSASGRWDLVQRFDDV